MSALRVLGYGLVRAVELVAAFATALGISLALIGWFAGPSDHVHGGLTLLVPGLMLAVPGSIIWLIAYLIRRVIARPARPGSLPLRQN